MRSEADLKYQYETQRDPMNRVNTDLRYRLLRITFLFSLCAVIRVIRRRLLFLDHMFEQIVAIQKRVAKTLRIG